MKRRAFSLLFVLLVIGLLSLAIWALTDLTLRQIASAQHSQQRSDLLQVAQSCLDEAQRKLDKNPDWQENLTQEWPGGQRARLTFAKGEIPHSQNNLRGDRPVQGFAGLVPVGCVELVTLASVGRSALTARCLVHVPAYPFAIASNGPIEASGDFLVGAVRKPEQASSSLTLADLYPADIASLSNGNPSVVLDGNAEIAGSIRTPGSARLGPAVRVLGGVVARSPELPDLDVRSYDTAGRPFLHPLPASDTGMVLKGWNRADQGFIVTEGGLTLNDAVVYVQGDLEIHGGLSGIGALFVDGNVRIYDGVALSSNNGVAVAATGSLLVQGRGRDTSLSGLLYCEGPFTAESITLVGAFLSRSPDRLQMHNVTALQSTVGQQFAFPYPLLAFDPGSAGRDQGVVVPKASVFFDKTSQKFRTDWVDTTHIKIGQYPRTFATAQEGEDYMMRRGRQTPRGYSSWSQFFTQRQAEAIENLRPQIAKLDEEFQKSKDQKLAQGSFSLDLNRFIAKESRMRLLMGTQVLAWRKS